MSSEDVDRFKQWASDAAAKDLDGIDLCAACSKQQVRLPAGQRDEVLCSECRTKAEQSSEHMYFALRHLYETVMQHKLFEVDDEEIEQASFALRQVDGRDLP